jgi:hypothetical protein
MLAREALNKSNAPSPLMGEGWGEGDKSMRYPSPQPSPARGEGVNQGVPNIRIVLSHTSHPKVIPDAVSAAEDAAFPVAPAVR